MMDLALVLCISLGRTQADAGGPLAPICFSLSNPKAKLPVDDVLYLKKNWKAKDFQVLPSGNYGQYKSGNYYVISQDTPLLKQLEERFNLAIKVLELGNKNSNPKSQFPLAGSEFNERELGVLSRLIHRWTASSIPIAQLSDSKRLLFDIRSAIKFSNQGETVSISPNISFESQEALHAYTNIVGQKAGTLYEPDFETSSHHLYQYDGPILGTESTEGAICTKVLSAYGANEDFAGINLNLLEILGKIYQTKASEYQKKILKVLLPIQKSQPYLFRNMDQATLSEGEHQKLSRSVVSELQNHGYTSQEAENRANSMRFIGRDVTIDFVTGIKLFGMDVVNGPSSVRIWP